MNITGTTRRGVTQCKGSERGKFTLKKRGRMNPDENLHENPRGGRENEIEHRDEGYFVTSGMANSKESRVRASNTLKKQASKPGKAIHWARREEGAQGYFFLKFGGGSAIVRNW